EVLALDLDDVSGEEEASLGTGDDALLVEKPAAPANEGAAQGRGIGPNGKAVGKAAQEDPGKGLPVQLLGGLVRALPAEGHADELSGDAVDVPGGTGMDAKPFPKVAPELVLLHLLPGPQQ